jgi:mannose-6-phosphate isomerase-like protein (cupin superfamily)
MNSGHQEFLLNATSFLDNFRKGRNLQYARHLSWFNGGKPRRFLMDSKTLADSILDGTIVQVTKELKVDEMSWYDHPKFPGVRLKDIVRKDDTGESMSCHLVRVEPGFELGLHCHDSSMELHQVLKGEGKCSLGERMVDYRSGCMTIIPAATHHSVTAGDQGLWILATFVPPL